MSTALSRRTILKTGAASLGILAGGSLPEIAHARNADSKGTFPPGKTPVRLATYLGRNGNESQEESVKRIRASGFTAVCADFTKWTDAELAELKAALLKHDVVVFENIAYLNLIHPDEAKRQANLASIARKIEQGDKAGALLVGTVSGCRDPKYLINPHPDNWSKETWNLLARGVKQILKDTAGMRTALGMEAQITTNLDGPKAHKRLIDDVGDPRCAVNLDPVNMINLERYFHTTELLRECFDLLGESILGCHAKDTLIEPDIQTLHIQEVCPGRGVMDYAAYLTGMSRLKWPRAILAEHLPDNQYPEAHAYIRNMAEKAGVQIYA